ncbi:50S ribosomal protein L23 [Candidatus Azambacteria bacterium]|nr:50S ribosomal protein L23 [Candidatus Azambacteria bacterium]
MFKLPIFSSGFRKTKNTAGLKITDKSSVSKISKPKLNKKTSVRKSSETIKGNPVLGTPDFKNRISQSLRNPIITEKATILKDLNKYSFEIIDDASKNEIKKSIRDLYQVKVVGVNILKTAGKIKKRGRVIGWQPGHKKAVVTLKVGEKIDFGI